MSDKILVVDDSKEARDLIAAILDEREYSVITAAEGEEALEKIKRELPILIIADVLMPKMDGFTFFKELKKDHITARIPVIILTARAKMEESFNVIGVDGFFSKPINADLLLSKVDQLISKTPYSISQKSTVKKITAVATEEKVPEKQEWSPDLSQKKLVDISGKSILIYGAASQDLIDMVSMFEREHCNVEILHDEHLIIPAVNETSPDIILIQILDTMIMPLDALVYSLSSILKKQMLEFSASSKKKIFLYKIKEESPSKASFKSHFAEMKTIKRCEEKWGAQYLGVTSISYIVLQIKQYI